MPELPEVEVLVRHLRPQLLGQRIEQVEVRRDRVLAPTSARAFRKALEGARFGELARRGKYLQFHLCTRSDEPRILLGHLGMTGRMYFLPAKAPLPKHAAVILHCGARQFVFEDTRYFGRLTLDLSALDSLGPEPLDSERPPPAFLRGLKRSRQPIKVKLLDQALVAGVGNIYASESLYLAGISPRIQARRLTAAQVDRLWQAMREVLGSAIRTGSTLPLDFAGAGERDGFFYYGAGGNGAQADPELERFRVYDRAGQPCPECGRVIKRAVQANRSTFYCPGCQRPR